MKTIGFIKSKKENEYRRAVTVHDIGNVINKEYLFFEEGYGEENGFDDTELIQIGCNVVSRKEVLTKDIICDPKIGDAEYLNDLTKGQTIFGWIHAVQNKAVTDIIVNKELTAIAWEDMFEDGRHLFWRNNEIAGEAAIMHAFQCHGLMPYNAKVALLGMGNVAQGALKILTLLGADITVYGRKMEKLFQKNLPNYDVIVNAILWDTSRKDHIIYNSDLVRMRKGSMIIDISCDRNGGIESSIPTTIENPVYFVDGIAHYVVDHTPSLFFKTATKHISAVVSKYLDELSLDTIGNVINDAIIISKGKIINQAIIDFQSR